MSTPLEQLIAQWRELSAEQYQMAADFDAKHDQSGNAHACMGRGRIYLECADALAAAGPPPSLREQIEALEIGMGPESTHADSLYAGAYNQAIADVLAICAESAKETS